MAEELHTGYVPMEGVEVEYSLESSQSLLMPVHRSKGDALLGSTVADVSQRKRRSRRTPKGQSLKRADAAWYVFDNLSCEQAEDLLRQHGEHGTYLVAHFHDPESYGVSIRLSEGEDVIYKHYAVGISGNEFRVEGFNGGFPTIEGVVSVIGERMDPTKLVPIFHSYKCPKLRDQLWDGKPAYEARVYLTASSPGPDCETCDYSISVSSEEPPDYKQAQKYPEAAKRPLPLIVPIRPTLRRMMGNGPGGLEASGLPEEVSVAPEADVHHGCCWRLFHTDPRGSWYKPHKAGPVTAVILVIGWIVFLLLFGWIIALALVLVFILVVFAYILNFVCTGRCQIEEED